MSGTGDPAAAFADDSDSWADAERIRTRRAQGLPDVCDDPVAAAQVVADSWFDEQRDSGADRGAA